MTKVKSLIFQRLWYYRHLQLHLANECIVQNGAKSDSDGYIANVLIQFLHTYQRRIGETIDGILKYNCLHLAESLVYRNNNALHCIS